MEREQPWTEKTVRICQKLKSNRKRAVGILLIVLGVILGVVSRAAVGAGFQDFVSGILMGLSAGVLLVGILATLISFFKSK